MSLFILIFLSLLTSSHCSCGTSHRQLLLLAFSHISNFRPPPPPPSAAGDCLRHLLLPSQNLSGTVSWMFLRNITTLRTLDLSDNALDGSIPGGFWSSPALAAVNLAGNNLGGPLRFEKSGLLSLNLSNNRFTAAANISLLGRLRVLDLSQNKIFCAPPGLNELFHVEYLDLSFNSMAGEFPGDFPAIAGLRFLNLSHNNLTGEVGADALHKFGSSAFAKGGIFTHVMPPRAKKKTKKWILAAVTAAGVVILVAAIAAGVFCRRRKRLGSKEEEVEEGIGWVKEAKWAAEVVVFAKPLMELRFGDLVAATCGFGRESLMAEGGRIGAVYRAVLEGDMDVVVRVMERERGVEAAAAEAAFREVGKLRHRNILPLLGYCISGKEKLLLYEYMERGDLHRWLHELPAGDPAVEDWTGDTWEALPAATKPPSSSATTTSTGDWPTRHRIALGVARGLAFLHQGWVGSRSPVVHGHLVPSNILLSGDLEPRISDFFAGDFCGATAEDDVYSYGAVVMELVTGRRDWDADEVERLRAVVREGSPAAVAEVVDRRLVVDEVFEKEAVECLRVAYLCTAKSPEKRPAMQQVVALLKDVRTDVAGGESPCIS